MAKQLAKVADIAALDAHEGACARLKITVPSAWHGATLAIEAPKRLTCHRCDGGGCDSCARSGAFTCPAEPAERRFEMTLPQALKPVSRIRVPAPFDAGAIGQLIVEVRVGDEPSRGVSRLLTPKAIGPYSATRPPAIPTPVVVLALVLLVLLGVLFTM